MGEVTRILQSVERGDPQALQFLGGLRRTN